MDGFRSNFLWPVCLFVSIRQGRKASKLQMIREETFKELVQGGNLFLARNSVELSLSKGGKDVHESKFIDRIVQEIWSKLPSKINVEDEGLIGMKSRIEKISNVHAFDTKKSVLKFTLEKFEYLSIHISVERMEKKTVSVLAELGLEENHSLFQLRKRQKTTRSLVLAPIWDLTSLTSLDLTDCNLLEGAIPGELGSLFSLENLCLGGNNFENLPSLNRLSQLAHLELNRCTMLRELPELPSRIHRLFSNDCASLRVSADRFAMCKIEFGWFRHCRKLLDYGESEIVASTLLQQLLQVQRNHKCPSITIAFENVILPGRVIPEWFYNHTFTGDSVLLRLPHTSTGRVVFPKWYGFFVILEVINELKSCNLSKVAQRQLRQRSFSLGPFDCRITDVQVELMICDDRSHPMLKEAIFLRNTGNITCLEHTIMGFKIYDKLVSHVDPWNSDAGKIEVSMRSLSPGTVVVKKWGIRLLFNDDHEEESNLSFVLMPYLTTDASKEKIGEEMTYSNNKVARFLDLSHLLITQLDPTPTPFPKDSLGTFANKGFKLGIPLRRVIDVDKASIDSNQLVEVHRNNLEDSDVKRSQIYASFSLPHYKLRLKVVKQLRLYVRKNVECGKMQEEGPKKKSISILKPEATNPQTYASFRALRHHKLRSSQYFKAHKLDPIWLCGAQRVYRELIRR
ncbi:hypothetical protein LguiA_007282 [Lonicera macranthoides]